MRNCPGYRRSCVFSFGLLAILGLGTSLQAAAVPDPAGLPPTISHGDSAIPPIEPPSVVLATADPGQVTLTVTSLVPGAVQVTPARTSFFTNEIAELLVNLASTNTQQPVTGAWHFGGWAGDATGFENPLRVPMDRDKTIHAIIEAADPLQRLTGGSMYLAGPAIAQDGTVYLGWDGLIYSLTPDMRTNWVAGDGSSPIYCTGRIVIGDSGNLYVPAIDASVYCLSPGGQILWKFISGDHPRPDFDNLRVKSALTSDGTLYYSVPATSNLTYVVKDGTLLRTLAKDQVPVIGPDDTLYLGNPDGFSSQKPFGHTNWTSFLPLPVAIDAAGRLYSIAASDLVALDFDGRELWRTTLSAPASEVLIGENGRVFARASNSLTALDTSGHILWTNATNGNIPIEPGGFVPLNDGGALILEDFSVLGSYFGSFGFYVRGSFRRILPDGQSGQFSTYNELGFVKYVTDPGDPVLSDAGDLYVQWPGRNPPLASNQTTSFFHWKSPVGIARSSWPNPFGRRNTGRAVSPSSSPSLAVVKSGSDWIIRASAMTAAATLETSTNLRDWQSLGPISTDFALETGPDSPRFYRLRTAP